jgi:hypothetical protein
MVSDIQKYPGHYSALALLLSISFVCYLLSYPIAVMQMVVVLIAAGGYVIWGILHHLAIGDYTHEIMLEYLALAFLFIIMLWSYLFFI